MEAVVRTLRVIGVALFFAVGVAGSAFSQCPNWDPQTGKIIYNCGTVGIGTPTAPSPLTVNGAGSFSGGTQSGPNGYPYDLVSQVTQIGFDSSTGINAGF